MCHWLNHGSNINLDVVLLPMLSLPVSSLAFAFQAGMLLIGFCDHSQLEACNSISPEANLGQISTRSMLASPALFCCNC